MKNLYLIGGTMERLLRENKRFWEQAILHKVNYLLIEDKYEIDIADCGF